MSSFHVPPLSLPLFFLLRFLLPLPSLFFFFSPVFCPSLLCLIFILARDYNNFPVWPPCLGVLFLKGPLIGPLRLSKGETSSCSSVPPCFMRYLNEGFWVFPVCALLLLCTPPLFEMRPRISTRDCVPPLVRRLVTLL